MILGVACSGLSLLGISRLATTGAGLMIAMAVAGMANGIIQPAANLALARGVVHGRQGIVFGIKQAAIPIATLTAGISVHLTAVGLSRRSVFGIAAVAAVRVVLWTARWRKVCAADARPGNGDTTKVTDRRPVGPTQANGPSEADASTPRRSTGATVLPLAIAGTCGSAAANSLGTFYVESAMAGAR